MNNDEDEAVEAGVFNPYPGLRPFQFEEAHLFFGRDEQRNELLNRLRSSRFLAVVGTSGSGKSSLVRAGLLPGLHAGFMDRAGTRWRIADTRPGGNPIGRLAAALDKAGVLRDRELGENELSFTETSLRRSAHGLVTAVKEAHLPEHQRLLVLVDQFEELFRFVDETDQAVDAANDASAFVKLLLAAVHQDEVPIYVVLTMRTDYLGDCARFRNLPEAINEGQYLIPRLTRSQRREAIIGPAAIQNVHFSPILLNRLLNDVGDNPDQLPILQHALMRTWGNWHDSAPEDSEIMLNHYEEIGGMSSALSRHAESIYQGLARGLSKQNGERRKLIAEKMFKCLTEETETNHQVRRLATLKEIARSARAEIDEVKSIVDEFREPESSFLMPPHDEKLKAKTYIDISHESLIRNWTRLKEWAHEEAGSADAYERLAHNARLWDKGDEDLMTGRRLRMTLEWEQKQNPTKAWARRYDEDYELAMRFLDMSEIAKLLAEKKVKTRRWAKYSIWLIIFAPVVFVVMFLALGNLEKMIALEQMRKDDLVLKRAYELWHKHGSDKLAIENPVTVIRILRRLRSPDHRKLGDTVIKALQQGGLPSEQDTQLFYVFQDKRHARFVLRADYPDSPQLIIAEGFLERKNKEKARLSILDLVTIDKEKHPDVYDGMKMLAGFAPFLLVVSVFPIGRWYCLACWRRENRENRLKNDPDRRVYKAKPNPVWRFFAAATDFVVAVAFGVLVGVLAGMIWYISESFQELREVSTDDAFLVGISWGLPVAGLYWLLRDGINFRYRRSIGKIVFGLCPVKLSGEELTYKTSAFYHSSLVIVVAILFLIVYQDAFETLAWGLLLYLVSTLIWLILTLVKDGRTIADRVAGVRVVDVRSEEARRLEVSSIARFSGRESNFNETGLAGT